MKKKLETVEWVVLAIIATNILTQDWNSISVLDWIVFASSAVVVILLGMKLFRKE